MNLLSFLSLRSVLLTFSLLLALPSSGLAQTLSVLFSSYTPPYVFRQGGEKGGGIVMEIVREALEGEGYTIKPVFLPMGRGYKMFAEGQLDATTIIQKSSGLDAHYSDIFMQYHNAAITRTDRNLHIQTLNDLQNLDLIAFQKANKYLGRDFGIMAKKNPNYVEMGNQERQVHMLLAGRAEVVVMDESIFRFYRIKLINEGKVSPDVDVTFHPLFSPTQYHTAFTSAKVRDAFNRGLANLKTSGRYSEIYHKYTQSYFEIKE